MGRPLFSTLVAVALLTGCGGGALPADWDTVYDRLATSDCLKRSVGVTRIPEDDVIALAAPGGSLVVYVPPFVTVSFWSDHFEADDARFDYFVDGATTGADLFMKGNVVMRWEEEPTDSHRAAVEHCLTEAD